MKSKKTLYLKLFLSTFYLSAFTFGGGFVIIPLMRKKFVGDLHWIEEDDIINLITIAQSSPGAVAVNASILLGYRIGKIPGALISVLGTILPPFLILTVISFFTENMFCEVYHNINNDCRNSSLHSLHQCANDNIVTK